MSFKAESWLADNCDIDHLGKRFLLFSMANMANDEGTLTLKNLSCVKRIRVSERTIQRWTAELVADGWIEKTPDHSKNDGRQLSNVYRIVIPAQEPAPPKRSPAAGRGEGDIAVSPSPLTAPVTPGVTPERHPRGDTHGVTPINQTENPYGEPTNTPPSPLPGGAAPSTRATQAERAALAGLQALKERLWTEQRRHVDRKIGRAIKSRLRAGESVESLWADYFALTSHGWDLPTCGDSSAVELLRRITAAIRDQISNHSWCTWIVPLQAVSLSPDPGANHRVLTVAFPDSQGQDWLVKNYGEAIQTAAIAEGIGGVAFWQPVRGSAA